MVQSTVQPPGRGMSSPVRQERFPRDLACIRPMPEENKHFFLETEREGFLTNRAAGQRTALLGKVLKNSVCGKMSFKGEGCEAFKKVIKMWKLNIERDNGGKQ